MEGFTPFTTRPYFAIQRCVALTNDCEVMQHNTQMKFTSLSFLLVLFDPYFFLIFYYMNKKIAGMKILKKIPVYIFYFWLQNMSNKI